MHKNRVALLLTLLTITAAPAQASAQSIASPYSFLDKKRDIGVFVGYVLADQGTAGLGPKAGPLVGAQFTLRVSEPINIGFYAAYFPSDRDVIDPAAESEAERITGETSLNLFLLALRPQLHLTGSRKWHNLVPIVYGGLGIAFDVTPGISCLPTIIPPNPSCLLSPRERFSYGTSLLGQFGLAMSWVPAQRLGLRFSIDDSIWRLSTPDGFYDDTSTLDPVPPEKNWTNNIQLNLGLYFRF